MQRIASSQSRRLQPQTNPTEHRVKLHHATHALRRTHPQLSAAFGFSQLQILLIICAVFTASFAVIALPRLAEHTGLALLILPYTFVVALRVMVLSKLPSATGPRDPPPLPVGDDKLPRYTVLVALYREAAVAPQLIEALARLDYPRDKLEIFLITEASDHTTRKALEDAISHPEFRVLTVPKGPIQTKPRALNYALQEATGDIVVIYDAEDEPEPDQLRRAAAIFAASHGKIGCVQAVLGIHNARQSWLTRQFAIEYAALFNCVLPALERLGHPIPLGGTSNHFPRELLKTIGGWDPYNVTEDADLGIRLSRMGFNVRILFSTTWEEAPTTFPVWFNQRTRWLKGWMQTLMVHTRSPATILTDLGLTSTVAFACLMATMVLSALVYPLVLISLLWSLVLEEAPANGRGILWIVGISNFVGGYATGLVIATVAAWRTGGLTLVRSVVWLPVYWLLISAAAYRALYELLHRPYHWHKTPHVGRARQSLLPDRANVAIKAASVGSCR